MGSLYVWVCRAPREIDRKSLSPSSRKSYSDHPVQLHYIYPFVRDNFCFFSNPHFFLCQSHASKEGDLVPPNFPSKNKE